MMSKFKCFAFWLLLFISGTASGADQVAGLFTPPEFFVNAKSEQPLQVISSSAFFPSQSPSGFAVPSAGSGPCRRFLDTRHFIGSGDVSQIVLSWVQATLVPGSGVQLVGNGYTVIGAVIVYNSTYAPVFFSASRTTTINDGDSDIKSDPVLPSSFGATKFAWGDPYDIKEIREYANCSTAKETSNVVNRLADSQSIAYDIAHCVPAVALDSVTPFWNGGGLSSVGGNPCNFGTDFVQAPYSAPISLGRFVTGSPKVIALAGDSKTAGIGDTVTAAGAAGLSRVLFPTSTSPTNAYAGLNFGCSSGIAADWASGTPSLLTRYLAYLNIGIESYGTNAQDAAASQAIHAQMRAGLSGRKQIIRLSLTPRTGDLVDSWQTEANQTISGGWGSGSGAETFQNTMISLVGNDFTYFDSLAQRGVDYWKWVVSGAAFYSTGDGLHESPQGYELRVHSNGSIIRPSGTTTGTLKSIIDALP